MIKTSFSRQIPTKIRKDGSKTVWQPRFYEHCIRDERDFQRHVEYIHYNPVKHGYVKRAADWQHSSIHRYIKLGMLNEQWGGAELDFVEMIGDE